MQPSIGTLLTPHDASGRGWGATRHWGQHNADTVCPGSLDSNKQVSQLKQGKQAFQNTHKANKSKANMPHAKHSSPTTMHRGRTQQFLSWAFAHRIVYDILDSVAALLASPVPFMGSCALHCRRCFGFGSATLLESLVPFMGFCALHCLGRFSAATLHLSYAVDCLSIRLGRFTSELPHRAKNPPIPCTAVTCAQLLLSFHDMQNVSQSSPVCRQPCPLLSFRLKVWLLSLC